MLHGDFWPGNVMWRDGGLVAVIDREDASVGDPLSDLACARAELLCLYGHSAMEAFTSHYLAAHPIDCARLPLWEVYASAAALATMGQWGLEPGEERERRRSTTAFLERAGEELLRRLR